MPQPLLDHLEIHSGRQHQGCLGMTQIVKNKGFRDTGRFTDGISDVSVEVRAAKITTPDIREHNRHLLWFESFVLRFRQTALQ